MHTSSKLAILAIAGSAFGSPAILPPLPVGVPNAAVPALPVPTAAVSALPVGVPTGGPLEVPSTGDVAPLATSLANGTLPLGAGQVPNATSAVPDVTGTLANNPLTPILASILTIMTTITGAFPTLTGATDAASGATNLLPRMHARQLPGIPAVPKPALPAGGSSALVGSTDGLTGSLSGSLTSVAGAAQAPASAVDTASVPITSTAFGATGDGDELPYVGAGVGTLDAGDSGLAQLLDNLVANLKYILNLEKSTAGLPI